MYGAEVTGVDHTRKLDLMRSIGADHVLDYTQEDFTKSGQQYSLDSLPTDCFFWEELVDTFPNTARHSFPF